MNVTVTEATGPGFVTVYPCSAGRPTASNLNYVARQTVPNLVTVAVRADRRVCFYVSGATQLLADLAGSYSPTSSVGFVGFAPPDRRMDTRTGARPASGATTSFSFGPGIVETPDLIVAVVLNVTAVEPVAAGFVTAYPCASGRPTASNVNYVAGDVVPNQVIVAVDEDDDVCFYTHQSTHLVVDEAGFFTAVPYLTAVVVR